MGIPGFYNGYLKRQVAEAIIKGLPRLVSSLAFDLNGIFHEARNKVFGDTQDAQMLEVLANVSPDQLELELQNQIEQILIQVINAVNPQDCLIFAVDGVAPAAKMQQQRGRRERSAKDQLPGDRFDRNAITPGTDFMIRLDVFMQRFIAKYRNYLPPQVIYSSHLVPGEGEHKIMDLYRDGTVSGGPAAIENGAHILYGLDADLVMLSLLAPINNIYLARETLSEVVQIDKFKEYLINQTKRDSAVDDFVVMMFLMGNDFLPHIPCFENMEQSITLLLDIYIAGDYVLTIQETDTRRRINWDHMKRYLQEVAQHENQLLATLSTQQFKYPSRFLNAALIEGQFYPENFRSSWYQNALGTKGNEEYVVAITQIIGYPISEITADRVVIMCKDYLRTMEWIYLYYREGTSAINHDWAYSYYHTPMLTDLSSVANTIESDSLIGYQAYYGMKPFTVLHQLIAVLPLKSKPLLPTELQPLFDDNSILRDYFPSNFIIEMDGKNKEHLGVPIVPLIDRRRIIDAVAQIVFSTARIKQWLPVETKYYTRTPDEAEILATQQFIREQHDNFVRRQDKTKRGRGQSRGGTTPYRGRGQSRGGSTGYRGRGQSRGGTTGYRGRGQSRGGTTSTINRPPATLSQAPPPTFTIETPSTVMQPPTSAITTVPTIPISSTRGTPRGTFRGAPRGGSIQQWGSTPNLM